MSELNTMKLEREKVLDEVNGLLSDNDSMICITESGLYRWRWGVHVSKDEFDNIYFALADLIQYLDEWISEREEDQSYY